MVKDVLAMSNTQNGGKIIFGVTAGRTSLKKYPPSGRERYGLVTTSGAELRARLLQASANRT